MVRALGAPAANAVRDTAPVQDKTLWVIQTKAELACAA